MRAISAELATADAATQADVDAPAAPTAQAGRSRRCPTQGDAPAQPQPQPSRRPQLRAAPETARRTPPARAEGDATRSPRRSQLRDRPRPVRAAPQPRRAQLAAERARRASSSSSAAVATPRAPPSRRRRMTPLEQAVHDLLDASSPTRHVRRASRRRSADDAARRRSRRSLRRSHAPIAARRCRPRPTPAAPVADAATLASPPSSLIARATSHLVLDEAERTRRRDGRGPRHRSQRRAPRDATTRPPPPSPATPRRSTTRCAARGLAARRVPRERDPREHAARREAEAARERRQRPTPSDSRSRRTHDRSTNQLHHLGTSRRRRPRRRARSRAARTSSSSCSWRSSSTRIRSTRSGADMVAQLAQFSRVEQATADQPAARRLDGAAGVGGEREPVEPRRPRVQRQRRRLHASTAAGERRRRSRSSSTSAIERRLDRRSPTPNGKEIRRIADPRRPAATVAVGRQGRERQRGPSRQLQISVDSGTTTATITAQWHGRVDARRAHRERTAPAHGRHPDLARRITSIGATIPTPAPPLPRSAITAVTSTTGANP